MGKKAGRLDSKRHSRYVWAWRECGRLPVIRQSAYTNMFQNSRGGLGARWRVDALPPGPAIRPLNLVRCRDAQTSGLRGPAPGEPLPLPLHTHTPTLYSIAAIVTAVQSVLTLSSHFRQRASSVDSRVRDDASRRVWIRANQHLLPHAHTHARTRRTRTHTRTDARLVPPSL